MKTAMQNKDTARLSVLRSLLSQTLNASKTSSPINTDMQMLALVRKTANASRAASEDFTKAGRKDLADKEESQLKIMEEYAGSVQVMGEEEVQAVIKSTLDALKMEGAKLDTKTVLARIFSPEVLGNAPVEKAKVAKWVSATLADIPKV